MDIYQRLIRTVGALMLLTLPLVASDVDEPTQAITPDDVERLLVPICPPGQEGRFGALWACEMWVRNSADVPVVFGKGSPFNLIGGIVQIEAHSTTSRASALRGAIYVVEKQYADDVHFSVRIADESRRPVSQGTEIPIVRERDWLTRPAELLDIPTDPAVRQTLRVYDVDAYKGSVRVTIYPLGEDQILAEAQLNLTSSNDRNLDPVWYAGPDYAEITDLVAAFPQIAVHERVRVRVEPLSPGMRFWAFVTITDNMTQQVTVVTPQ